MRSKYLLYYPKKTFEVLNKKQRFYIILYWFSLISLSVFETIGLGVLALFVGFLSNPDFLIQKIPFQNLQLFFLNMEYKYLILMIGIFIIILFFIKNFLIVFVNIFELKLRKNFISTISHEIFSDIIQRPYEYFTRINSATITNDIVNESNRVANFIFGYNNFYKEIFLIIILFIPLLIINPLITFGASFIFLIFTLFFLRKIKAQLVFFGDKIKKHSELMFRSIREIIDSISLVKLSNKNDFFVNKYLNQFNLMSMFANFKRIYSLIPRMFFEITSVVLIVSFSVILIFSGIKIDLLISYLSFIALAAIRMVPSFTILNLNFSNIIFNEKPFQNYLQAKYFESDKKNLKNEKKLLEVNDINEIELEKVYFKYINQEDYIVENISLKLKKNLILGIVGESGSGKSTISKLLIGLLEPSKGKLKVNSYDANLINRKWQKDIGFIPQDIFLSESSLMKNIAMNKNINEIDIDKINYSIKNALLKDLVDNSKDGINLLIRDRGINISGGQKQRIGIARAIYNNPSLLILDEPTSNLDKESQILFQKCLLEIKKNKIVVLITHSHEMLNNCDSVYQLKNKKLTHVK